MRAFALHRAGKATNFIYRALWPDGAPVAESTFSTALSDLIHDMDRLALMRQQAAALQGSNASELENINLAIRGESTLPEDLRETRDALLETQRIMLKRLRREDAGEQDARVMTNLGGTITSTAQRILSIQRYRVDMAVLQANFAPPADEPPLAHPSQPAVVLEMPRKTA